MNGLDEAEVWTKQRSWMKQRAGRGRGVDEAQVWMNERAVQMSRLAGCMGCSNIQSQNIRL